MLITDSQKSPDIPRNRLLIELQEKVKNIQVLTKFGNCCKFDLCVWHYTSAFYFVYICVEEKIKVLINCNCRNSSKNSIMMRP